MTANPAIRAQVVAANDRFYRAFEHLDLDAMDDVWEHGDRSACLHPGGAWLSGWEEVRRGWEVVMSATGTIDFEVTDVDVWVEDPVAWVTCVERVTGAGGPPAEVAATNVFVLGPRGWRMVLHQASPVVRPDAFSG